MKFIISRNVDLAWDLKAAHDMHIDVAAELGDWEGWRLAEVDCPDFSVDDIRHIENGMYVVSVLPATGSQVVHGLAKFENDSYLPFWSAFIFQVPADNDDED